MPALFPKFVGIKSCFALPHAINPIGLSFRRIGIIPVYITENGHGCYETPGPDGRVEDDDRIDMMQGYIDNMLLAMDDGCDVRGYYAWSPMDLYSWVNGYEKRYGLVYVDFDDPARPRTPKKSYYWFKKLIEDYRHDRES